MNKMSLEIFSLYKTSLNHLTLVYIDPQPIHPSNIIYKENCWSLCLYFEHLRQEPQNFIIQEKTQGRIVIYGGDAFQKDLFVLAPDSGPYKQKFENGDPLMDAKFKSKSRLQEKQFPILYVADSVGFKVEKS